MQNLKFLPLPTLSLLSLFICSPGDSAPVPDPKAKAVLDKAFAALGGEKFHNLHNRVEHGRVYSFFHERMSGLSIATIYTEYLEAAAGGALGVRERESFGKKQDYSTLLLPDQGWDITYRGARPLPDETWQRYRRTTLSNIFYILRVRYDDEAGLLFDYAGSDVISNTQVDIIDITDAQRHAVRVFFDHNTGLPLRQSFEWLDETTRERNDEVTDFSKYRDAGGVTLPFTVHREVNGYKTYELFADRIATNEDLPQQTFALPQGARVLKKME